MFCYSCLLLFLLTNIIRSFVSRFNIFKVCFDSLATDYSQSIIHWTSFSGQNLLEKPSIAIFGILELFQNQITNSLRVGCVFRRSSSSSSPRDPGCFHVSVVITLDHDYAGRGRARRHPLPLPLPLPLRLGVGV